ncbi:hypothetical protein K1719_003832 [Acacia pycnantha]|nr:hypothetical protein K1719_003832 [Acacia pycnantha]
MDRHRNLFLSLRRSQVRPKHKDNDFFLLLSNLACATVSSARCVSVCYGRANKHRSKQKETLKPSEGAQNYQHQHQHHSYGYRGRGRGRGIGGPRPVTKLHYDFDFMAMNEKFNKDEVWGHLGKTKSHSKEKDGEDVSDEDDGQDGYNGEESKNEVKTCGDFVRPWGGRGGRGLLRGGGGRSRGGYYGQWVEKQDRKICELRSALNAHISDTELRILVDGIMNHYSHLFRMKSAAAKVDVFYVLFGMWKTTLNGFSCGLEDFAHPSFSRFLSL